MCGCADYLTANEAEVDQYGNKLFEHFVGYELRYLRSRAECTPHLQTKGWRHRIERARDAMERDICKPCLIATQEMSAEFRRKRDKELGHKNHDPYYMAVCGE